MLVLTPEIVRGAERAFARAGAGAEAVLAGATAALSAGPFSVMQKAGLPPSGDRHDYLSPARATDLSPGREPWVRCILCVSEPWKGDTAGRVALPGLRMT